MEQALIELVKSGVPLAKWAIMLYYLNYIIFYAFTSGTILGVTTMLYKILKPLADVYIENERADTQARIKRYGG